MQLTLENSSRFTLILEDNAYCSPGFSSLSLPFSSFWLNIQWSTNSIVLHSRFTFSPIHSSIHINFLQFVLTGAAPAGKDICDEFLARHKNIVKLCQGNRWLITVVNEYTWGYGMTECGMASHLPDFSLKDAHVGVGKVAANFEQKVIDYLPLILWTVPCRLLMWAQERKSPQENEERYCTIL